MQVLESVRSDIFRDGTLASPCRIWKVTSRIKFRQDLDQARHNEIVLMPSQDVQRIKQKIKHYATPYRKRFLTSCTSPT